jgi:hypothetical protein
LLLVLIASGCGGEERGLSRDLAERLAVRSESVASEVEAGNPCEARADAEQLQTETIAAVNEGSVPEELQEELLGSVNALLAAIACDPPVAPESAAVDARRLADLLRENGG